MRSKTTLTMMFATPDNTAVVTILAYERDDLIPLTVNFFLHSARRMKIPLNIFMRGEKYRYKEKEIDQSYFSKLVRLKPCIETLPYHYDYIFYVDARDVLFFRPLSVICEHYNKIGWPILMSSERVCHHHIDPGWIARFPKHRSGFNFNNAGIWIAERNALMNAFDKLEELSPLVKDDKIDSSFPPLWSNDQHMWQTAYVEQAFPMRLDFEQKIFMHFTSTPPDMIGFDKSTEETPVVLKTGEMPSLVHFTGKSAGGLPYFAWMFGLLNPGQIPPLIIP